jgi:hypothetical protein
MEGAQEGRDLFREKKREKRKKLTEQKMIWLGFATHQTAVCHQLKFAKFCM